MAGTEYSYFDQFSDIIVDLSPYLKTMSDEIGSEYSFSNIQPIKTTLKNLFKKVEISDEIKKNILWFDVYEVKDGEAIYSIAYHYYNNVNYWWIICLFNNIKNVWMDWLYTEEQMQLMAEKLFSEEGRYTKDTYYKLLFEKNETKRNILLIKPQYLNTVISSFRTAIER